MTAKLNKDKHYGEIWGHAWAKYEQNGVLFDARGLPRELSDEPAAQAKETEQQTQQADSVHDDADKVRAFIIEMLKEGPISKSNLYRECESRGMKWEDVQKVAPVMKVESYKQKNTEYWKLTEAV